MLIFFLWKSFFASAGTDVVSGMTFSGTLIYLVLAAALFSFMEMYLVWYMGRDIQSGKIVLDLIKPIRYRSFLFWTQSGFLVMSFVMTFLPPFLVVYFLTDGTIHLGVNLLFFLVSVPLALTINFCIDCFIGTLRQGKYTRAKKLTPRMLNELVNHIEVHQAEKINGEWVQILTIYYYCGGALSIPDTPSKPVPDVTVNTRRGVYVSYEPAQNGQ